MNASLPHSIRTVVRDRVTTGVTDGVIGATIRFRPDATIRFRPARTTRPKC
ncbi:MAG TPA: hypothetical protein VHV32_05060 [Candidatus Angelobacter sp.]|nr:hypothetical protein [Candidatus Angelobacter sp.]